MKILLAVTGSIAAYKTYDICRGLLKNGHEVQVLLSYGAKKFIRQETFKYLGAVAAYGPDDDFARLAPGVLHVELAKWCDVMAIIPCSANTLARLAQAQASDLIGQTHLCLQDRPLIIYPAMNPKMLKHHLVEANLSKLEKTPHTFLVYPEVGPMACGDIGQGKLPHVDSIVETLPFLAQRPQEPTQGMRILITTGATYAPIDSVRYVTNPASGKTGYLLARELLSRGHEVKVLSGDPLFPKLEYLQAFPRFSLLQASTTREMYEEVMGCVDSSDVFISAAALADMEFSYSEEKLKKEEMTGSLQYKRAPDVLDAVLKGRRKEQLIVGFAAESSLEEGRVLEKLRKKPVDFLVANSVQGHSPCSKISLKGFGRTAGEYMIYSGKKQTFRGELSKEELAKYLAEELENAFYKGEGIARGARKEVEFERDRPRSHDGKPALRS